ncbi:hypothetical protein DBR06_SOUSAS4510094, partial [Sousa chinensis]
SSQMDHLDQLLLGVKNECFFTAIMESSQLRGVLPSPTTATSWSPGLANADEVQ